MLYIWMPERDGAWKWSLGDDWQVVHTLDQLIRDIAHLTVQEALVFFPSEMTQLFVHSLPKAQYQKMGQDAAPYLVEDDLIQSIDQFKILQKFQAPETLHLLAIAHQQVQTLQHALSLLPIRLAGLLPDFLLVQVAEINQIHIQLYEGRYLIRESDMQGRVVDDLDFYLQYQATDQQYQMSGFDAQTLQKFAQQYPEASFSQIDQSWVFDKKLQQHVWNVLPKSRKTSSWSAPWKGCAALLVAIVIAQFTYDALRWGYNKKVADQTAQQAIEQYQSWFGTQGRVSEQNLKSQFESHLRQSKRAQVQGLDLLSRVGPLLMQHNVVAEQLQIQDHMLQLTLKAQTTEQLQALVEQIKQQGLQVELGRVDALSGAAVGEIKVQS